MGRMVEPSPAILSYLTQYGGRETAVQRRCREETAQRDDAVMQIAPEQAAALAFLVRLTGARRCVEIGVFTGYSALAVALVLPPDGRIVALDVSRDYTDIARRYWREAGIADKIDLRLGPARESLEAMIAAGEGPFDFAFIDADKTQYDAYYERALALLRPGGLIALDNMLYSGAVAEAGAREPGPKALRALNAKIHADSRVDMALTTIGDGMMLARKR
jgi:caffeoyl-CoA O-methyltransferase